MEVLWGMVVFGPFLAPLGAYLLGCLIRRRSFARQRFAPVGSYYAFLAGAVAIAALLGVIRDEPPLDKMGVLFAFFFVGVIFWGLGLLLGLAVLFIELKRGPMITHFCRGCGYDLTGNISGVCSECGAVISWEQREVLGRQRPGLGSQE